jgi:GNAT superfamily N-acetyltransferase
MNGVRRAALADAEAIARVHVASWRAAYPGMIPQDVLDGLSVEQRTQRWAELLADISNGRSQRDVLFVNADDVVRGFSYAAPSDDDDASDAGNTALLHAIYLDQSAWGTGLGAALLEATINDLRSRSFTHATLWVIEANERARRFYEAHGWYADGSSKTCFGMDVSVDVPTLRYARAL